MAEDVARFSPEISELLARFREAPSQVVHRLQVGLARLVLDQAPPSASSQLQLAVAFIEGRVGEPELRDARQDCWTFVGSLACGCSISDSASAHAVMTCLESDEAAHGASSLSDQIMRVLRCGVSEAEILTVLRDAELV
jgi:hypothetical protein